MGADDDWMEVDSEDDGHPQQAPQAQRAKQQSAAAAASQPAARQQKAAAVEEEDEEQQEEEAGAAAAGAAAQGANDGDGDEDLEEVPSCVREVDGTELKVGGWVCCLHYKPVYLRTCRP